VTPDASCDEVQSRLDRCESNRHELVDLVLALFAYASVAFARRQVRARIKAAVTTCATAVIDCTASCQVKTPHLQSSLALTR
jgi:hypothetical protein